MWKEVIGILACVVGLLLLLHAVFQVVGVDNKAEVVYPSVEYVEVPSPFCECPGMVKPTTPVINEI